MCRGIDEILAAADSATEGALRGLLQRIVPEYMPEGETGAAPVKSAGRLEAAREPLASGGPGSVEDAVQRIASA